MDGKNIILLVSLSLLVISSGCVGQINDQLDLENIANFGSGDSQTQKGSISVLKLEKFDITPSNISEGEISEVILKVSNPSEENIELIIDENGENVLTNYCSDILRIEKFKVRKEGMDRSVKNLELESGEEAELFWKLEGKKVPQEVQCNVQVNPTVKASTRAFSQVQYKNSGELPSSNLDSGSKEACDLKIEVEPEGKGSYIVGESSELYIKLQNRGEGDISLKKEDIEFENEGLKMECDVYDTMLRSGEKEKFECVLSLQGNTDSVSEIYEIYFRANYSYSISSDRYLVVNK